MAHAHIVSDSDNHFVIDPISRQLSSNSKKTILMKTDHNSEQFTFELPRTVEGHDMSTCNKVEVHYININSKTRQQSAGIYNVVDFGIDDEDDTKVLGTWLVSREATKYAGSLNFVLRFACVSADEVEEYSWNTAIYAGITIADGICNTETVVEDYVDILRQWLDTIEMAGSSGKVYVITDDGTITELGEMVNNFSEQVTELEGKITDLETANTEFKDSVNGAITEFKESVNSKVTEFKESVTEQQTTLVERLDGVEETVNSFNGRVESLEDFATIFQDNHMLTGTFGQTVLGTEGTYLIRFNGSNRIITKSSNNLVSSHDCIFDIGGVPNKTGYFKMEAYYIYIQNNGTLAGIYGVMCSVASDATQVGFHQIGDLTQPDSVTGAVPTFLYRKLS